MGKNAHSNANYDFGRNIVKTIKADIENSRWMGQAARLSTTNGLRLVLRKAM